MLRHHKTTIKFCAFILSFKMILADIVYAAPVDQMNLSVSPQQVILQDPARLEAPLDFSTLREIHKGDKKKLIIHIQDAHANFSGQQNLASVLDELMKKYKIDLVLVEGGSKDDTLTVLKAIASADVWKRVAKKFLMEAKIAGEEYLNLTSDHPMKIMGIENRDLYMKSLHAYSELAGKREDILLNLKRVRIGVEKIKNRVYPEGLKEYERETIDHRQQTTDKNFENGFKKLLSLRDPEGRSNLENFPNVQKLAEIQENEKNIDFNAANLEQAALVDEISKRGGKENLKSALTKINKAKNSKLSQLNFVETLFRTAKEKNVVFDKYPNLVAYEKYLKKFSGIDFENFFNEYERLEDEVYRSILTAERLPLNADALLIRSIDRYLGLLESAYRIQMTTKEFEMFKLNEPDFATTAYLAFINRKLADLEYFDDMIAYESIFEDAKSSLENFYQSVSERDDAFIRNTEKVLAEDKEEVAVLIAGGYHTKHLQKLFKEKGYSYAVLTPHVTSETNQKKYEKVLLEPIDAAHQSTRAPERQKDSLVPGAQVTGARDGIRAMPLMESGARLSAIAEFVQPDAGKRAYQALKAVTDGRAEDRGRRTEVRQQTIDNRLEIKREKPWFEETSQRITEYREQITKQIVDVGLRIMDSARMDSGVKNSHPIFSIHDSLSSGARLANEQVESQAIQKTFEAFRYYRPRWVRLYERVDSLSVFEKEQLKQEIYDLDYSFLALWGMGYALRQNAGRAQLLQQVFPKLDLNPLGFGLKWETEEEGLRSLEFVMRREMPGLMSRYDALDERNDMAVRALSKEVYRIGVKEIKSWGISKPMAAFYFGGSHGRALQKLLPKLHLNLIGFASDWSSEERAIETMRFWIGFHDPELMRQFEKIGSLTSTEIISLKRRIYSITSAEMRLWGLSAAFQRERAPYFGGKLSHAIESAFQHPLLSFSEEERRSLKTRRTRRYFWATPEDGIANVKNAVREHRRHLYEKYEQVDPSDEPALEVLRQEFYEISQAHFGVWGIGSAMTSSAPYFKHSFVLALLLSFPKLNLNPLGFEMDWSSEEKALESVRYVLSRRMPDLMAKYERLGDTESDEAFFIREKIYKISSTDFFSMGLGEALGLPYFEHKREKVLQKVFQKIALDPLGFRLDWSTPERAVESVRFVIRREMSPLVERYEKLSDSDLLEAEALREIVYGINSFHFKLWGLSSVTDRDKTPQFEGSYIHALQQVFPKLNLDSNKFSQIQPKRLATTDTFGARLSSIEPIRRAYPTFGDKRRKPDDRGQNPEGRRAPASAMPSPQDTVTISEEAKTRAANSGARLADVYQENLLKTISHVLDEYSWFFSVSAAEKNKILSQVKIRPSRDSVSSIRLFIQQDLPLIISSRYDVYAAVGVLSVFWLAIRSKSLSRLDFIRWSGASVSMFVLAYASWLAHRYLSLNPYFFFVPAHVAGGVDPDGNFFLSSRVVYSPDDSEELVDTAIHEVAHRIKVPNHTLLANAYVPVIKSRMGVLSADSRMDEAWIASQILDSQMPDADVDALIRKMSLRFQAYELEKKWGMLKGDQSKRERMVQYVLEQKNNLEDADYIVPQYDIEANRLWIYDYALTLGFYLLKKYEDPKKVVDILKALGQAKDSRDALGSGARLTYSSEPGARPRLPDGQVPDRQVRSSENKTGNEVNSSKRRAQYSELTGARLSSPIRVGAGVDAIDDNAGTFQVKQDAIFTDAKTMGSGRQVNQGFGEGHGRAGAYQITKFVADSLSSVFGDSFKFLRTLRSKFDFLEHELNQARPNFSLIFSKGTNPDFLASSMPFLSLATILGLSGILDSIASISQPTGFWVMYSLGVAFSSYFSSMAQSRSQRDVASNTKYLGTPSLPDKAATLKSLGDASPRDFKSFGGMIPSSLTNSLAESLTTFFIGKVSHGTAELSSAGARLTKNQERGERGEGRGRSVNKATSHLSPPASTLDIGARLAWNIPTAEHLLEIARAEKSHVVLDPSREFLARVSAFLGDLDLPSFWDRADDRGEYISFYALAANRKTTVEDISAALELPAGTRSLILAKGQDRVLTEEVFHLLENTPTNYPKQVVEVVDDFIQLMFYAEKFQSNYTPHWDSDIKLALLDRYRGKSVTPGDVKHVLNLLFEDVKARKDIFTSKGPIAIVSILLGEQDSADILNPDILKEIRGIEWSLLEDYVRILIRNEKFSKYQSLLAGARLAGQESSQLAVSSPQQKPDGARLSEEIGDRSQELGDRFMNSSVLNLTKEPLRHPHADHRQISDPFFGGNTLESDNLRLGESHRDQFLSRFGKLELGRLKLAQKSGRIMFVPISSLFFSGFELGQFTFGLLFHTSPSFSAESSFRIRHVSSRDHSDDSLSFVSGNDQNIPSVFRLAINQIRAVTSFQNIRFAVTSFLDFFGIDTMPGNVLDIVLIPFKVYDSQMFSPMRQLYMYIQEMSTYPVTRALVPGDGSEAAPGARLTKNQERGEGGEGRGRSVNKATSRLSPPASTLDIGARLAQENQPKARNLEVKLDRTKLPTFLISSLFYGLTIDAHKIMKGLEEHVIPLPENMTTLKFLSSDALISYAKYYFAYVPRLINHHSASFFAMVSLIYLIFLFLPQSQSAPSNKFKHLLNEASISLLVINIVFELIQAFQDLRQPDLGDLGFAAAGVFVARYFIQRGFVSGGARLSAISNDEKAIQDSAGISSTLTQALPTDVNLVRRGTSAFIAWIRQLNEADLTELQKFDPDYPWIRLVTVFMGIRPEAILQMTNFSGDAITAIEQVPGIRLNDNRMINIEATTRVIKNNPDDFPGEAQMEPLRWIEGYLIGSTDLSTVQYGLLSGYPRSAAKGFARVAEAKAALKKAETQPGFFSKVTFLQKISRLFLLGLLYFEARKLRDLPDLIDMQARPSIKKNLFILSLQHSGLLRDDQIQLLLSAGRHGGSGPGGNYVGFSKEDTEWSEQQHRLFADMLREFQNELRPFQLRDFESWLKEPEVDKAGARLSVRESVREFLENKPVSGSRRKEKIPYRVHLPLYHFVSLMYDPRQWIRRAFFDYQIKKEWSRQVSQISQRANLSPQQIKVIQAYLSQMEQAMGSLSHGAYDGTEIWKFILRNDKGYIFIASFVSTLFWNLFNRDKKYKPEVSFRLTFENDELKLVVSDNGSGMSHDELEKLGKWKESFEERDAGTHPLKRRFPTRFFGGRGGKMLGTVGMIIFHHVRDGKHVSDANYLENGQLGGSLKIVTRNESGQAYETERKYLYNKAFIAKRKDGAPVEQIQSPVSNSSRASRGTDIIFSLKIPISVQGSVVLAQGKWVDGTVVSGERSKSPHESRIKEKLFSNAETIAEDERLGRVYHMDTVRNLLSRPEMGYLISQIKLLEASSFVREEDRPSATPNYLLIGKDGKIKATLHVSVMEAFNTNERVAYLKHVASNREYHAGVFLFLRVLKRLKESGVARAHLTNINDIPGFTHRVLSPYVDYEQRSYRDFVIYLDTFDELADDERQQQHLYLKKIKEREKLVSKTFNDISPESNYRVLSTHNESGHYSFQGGSWYLINKENKKEEVVPSEFVRGRLAYDPAWRMVNADHEIIVGEEEFGLKKRVRFGARLALARQKSVAVHKPFASSELYSADTLEALRKFKEWARQNRRNGAKKRELVRMSFPSEMVDDYLTPDRWKDLPVNHPERLWVELLELMHRDYQVHLTRFHNFRSDGDWRKAQAVLRRIASLTQQGARLAKTSSEESSAIPSADDLVKRFRDLGGDEAAAQKIAMAYAKAWDMYVNGRKRRNLVSRMGEAVNNALTLIEWRADPQVIVAAFFYQMIEGDSNTPGKFINLEDNPDFKTNFPGAYPIILNVAKVSRIPFEGAVANERTVPNRMNREFQTLSHGEFLLYLSSKYNRVLRKLKKNVDRDVAEKWVTELKMLVAQIRRNQDRSVFIAEEIEDALAKLSDPDRYEKVTQELKQSTRHVGLPDLASLAESIEKVLRERGLQAQVYYRIKKPASILEKSREANDIYALRVVSDDPFTAEETVTAWLKEARSEASPDKPVMNIVVNDGEVMRDYKPHLHGWWVDMLGTLSSSSGQTFSLEIQYTDEEFHELNTRGSGTLAHWAYRLFLYTLQQIWWTSTPPNFRKQPALPSDDPETNWTAHQQIIRDRIYVPVYRLDAKKSIVWQDTLELPRDAHPLDAAVALERDNPTTTRFIKLDITAGHFPAAVFDHPDQSLSLVQPQEILSSGTILLEVDKLPDVPALRPQIKIWNKNSYLASTNQSIAASLYLAKAEKPKQDHKSWREAGVATVSGRLGMDILAWQSSERRSDLEEFADVIGLRGGVEDLFTAIGLGLYNPERWKADFDRYVKDRSYLPSMSVEVLSSPLSTTLYDNVQHIYRDFDIEHKSGQSALTAHTKTVYFERRPEKGAMMTIEEASERNWQAPTFEDVFLEMHRKVSGVSSSVSPTTQKSLFTEDDRRMFHAFATLQFVGHQYFPNKPEAATRKQGDAVPYATHPTDVMMILFHRFRAQLKEGESVVGAIALAASLIHDLFEDTQLSQLTDDQILKMTGLQKNSRAREAIKMARVATRHKDIGETDQKYDERLIASIRHEYKGNRRFYYAMLVMKLADKLASVYYDLDAVKDEDLDEKVATDILEFLEGRRAFVKYFANMLLRTENPELKKIVHYWNREYLAVYEKQIERIEKNPALGEKFVLEFMNQKKLYPTSINYDPANDIWDAKGVFHVRQEKSRFQVKKVSELSDEEFETFWGVIRTAYPPGWEGTWLQDPADRKRILRSEESDVEARAIFMLQEDGQRGGVVGGYIFTPKYNTLDAIAVKEDIRGQGATHALIAQFRHEFLQPDSEIKVLSLPIHLETPVDESGYSLIPNTHLEDILGIGDSAYPEDSGVWLQSPGSGEGAAVRDGARMARDKFDLHLEQNGFNKYPLLSRQFSEPLKVTLMSDPALRPVFLQVLDGDAIGPLVVVDRDGVNKLGGEDFFDNYSSFSVGTAESAERVLAAGGKIVIGVADKASQKTLMPLHQVANGRQVYFPLKDGSWLGVKGSGQYLDSNKPTYYPIYVKSSAPRRYMGIAHLYEVEGSILHHHSLKNKANHRLPFVQFLGYRRLLKAPDEQGGVSPMLGQRHGDDKPFEPVLIFNRTFSPHRFLKIRQLIEIDPSLSVLRQSVSRTLQRDGQLHNGRMLTPAELLTYIARQVGYAMALRQNAGLYVSTQHSQDITLAGELSDLEETYNLEGYLSELNRIEDHLESETIAQDGLSIRHLYSMTTAFSHFLDMLEPEQRTMYSPPGSDLILALANSYFSHLSNQYLDVWVSKNQDGDPRLSPKQKEIYNLFLELAKKEKDQRVRHELESPAAQRAMTAKLLEHHLFNRLNGNNPEILSHATDSDLSEDTDLIRSRRQGLYVWSQEILQFLAFLSPGTPDSQRDLFVLADDSYPPMFVTPLTQAYGDRYESLPKLSLGAIRRLDETVGFTDLYNKIQPSFQAIGAFAQADENVSLSDDEFLKEWKVLHKKALNAIRHASLSLTARDSYKDALRKSYSMSSGDNDSIAGIVLDQARNRLLGWLSYEGKSVEDMRRMIAEDVQEVFPDNQKVMKSELAHIEEVDGARLAVSEQPSLQEGKVGEMDPVSQLAVRGSQQKSLPSFSYAKGLVVEELLKILELEKAQVMDSFEFAEASLTVYQIKVPKAANLIDATGPSLLQVMASEKDEFYLLFNKKQELVAIVPVYPQGFNGYSDYWLFPIYNVPSHLLVDMSTLEARRAMHDAALSNNAAQAMALKFMNSRGFFLNKLPGASYVFAKINTQSGEMSSRLIEGSKFIALQEDDGIWGKRDAEIIFELQENQAGFLIPIFPTVYAPIYLEADGKFYKEVFQQFARADFSEGKNVLDAATGSGIALVIQWLQAKHMGVSQNLTFHAYDKNPLAVASARTLLKGMLGLKNVDIRVGDSPVVFGDKLFVYFSANSPAYPKNPDDRDKLPPNFYHMHDGYSTGVQFSESLSSYMAHRLTPRARGVVWNMDTDNRVVKKLFEDAGLSVVRLTNHLKDRDVYLVQRKPALSSVSSLSSLVSSPARGARLTENDGSQRHQVTRSPGTSHQLLNNVPDVGGQKTEGGDQLNIGGQKKQLTEEDFAREISAKALGIIRQLGSLDDVKTLLESARFVLVNLGRPTSLEMLVALEEIALLFGFEHKPDKDILDSYATIFKNLQVTPDELSQLFDRYYDNDNYKDGMNVEDALLKTETALSKVQIFSRTPYELFSRIKEPKSLLNKVRRGDDLEDMIGFNFIIDDTQLNVEERSEVLTHYSEQLTTVLSRYIPNTRIEVQRKESRVSGYEAVNIFIHGLLEHKELGSLPVKIQVRFKTAFYREFIMYFTYKRLGYFQMPPWANDIDFNSVTSFYDAQRLVFTKFKEWSSKLEGAPESVNLDEEIIMPDGWPFTFTEYANLATHAGGARLSAAKSQVSGLDNSNRATAESFPVTRSLLPGEDHSLSSMVYSLDEPLPLAHFHGARLVSTLAMSLPAGRGLSYPILALAPQPGIEFIGPGEKARMKREAREQKSPDEIVVDECARVMAVMGRAAAKMRALPTGFYDTRIPVQFRVMAPGDISADQIAKIRDLAQQFTGGQVSIYTGATLDAFKDVPVRKGERVVYVGMNEKPLLQAAARLSAAVMVVPDDFSTESLHALIDKIVPYTFLMRVDNPDALDYEWKQMWDNIRANPMVEWSRDVYTRITKVLPDATPEQYEDLVVRYMKVPWKAALEAATKALRFVSTAA